MTELLAWLLAPLALAAAWWHGREAGRRLRDAEVARLIAAVVAAAERHHPVNPPANDPQRP